MRDKLRKRLRISIILLLASILAVIYPTFLAINAGRGKLYDKIEDLPYTPVALVFGTSKEVGGHENLYFKYRMNAAAAVWHAGKVECIIVSGDNRSQYYNEPQQMYEALIERGVPKDRIVRDFAGLRTLDSVFRAKEVFLAPKVLLISQKFQNERASYLARACGLEHLGYNAIDVHSRYSIPVKVREIGARVKMWLDVRLLKTKPRHLGKPESLPLKSKP